MRGNIKFIVILEKLVTHNSNFEKMVTHISNFEKHSDFESTTTLQK